MTKESADLPPVVFRAVAGPDRLPDCCLKCGTPGEYCGHPRYPMDGGDSLWWCASCKWDFDEVDSDLCMSLWFDRRWPSI